MMIQKILTDLTRTYSARERVQDVGCTPRQQDGGAGPRGCEREHPGEANTQVPGCAGSHQYHPSLVSRPPSTGRVVNITAAKPLPQQVHHHNIASQESAAMSSDTAAGLESPSEEHLVQLIDACLNKGDAKGICDGLRLLFTNRKREHIQNRVSVASRSPEPIVLGVITRCLECSDSTLAGELASGWLSLVLENSSTAQRELILATPGLVSSLCALCENGSAQARVFGGMCLKALHIGMGVEKALALISLSNFPPCINSMLCSPIQEEKLSGTLILAELFVEGGEQAVNKIFSSCAVAVASLLSSLEESMQNSQLAALWCVGRLGRTSSGRMALKEADIMELLEKWVKSCEIWAGKDAEYALQARGLLLIALINSSMSDESDIDGHRRGEGGTRKCKGGRQHFDIRHADFNMAIHTLTPFLATACQHASLTWTSGCLHLGLWEILYSLSLLAGCGDAVMEEEFLNSCALDFILFTFQEALREIGQSREHSLRTMESDDAEAKYRQVWARWELALEHMGRCLNSLTNYKRCFELMACSGLPNALQIFVFLHEEGLKRGVCRHQSHDWIHSLVGIFCQDVSALDIGGPKNDSCVVRRINGAKKICGTDCGGHNLGVESSALSKPGRQDRTLVLSREAASPHSSAILVSEILAGGKPDSGSAQKSNAGEDTHCRDNNLQSRDPSADCVACEEHRKTVPVSHSTIMIDLSEHDENTPPFHFQRSPSRRSTPSDSSTSTKSLALRHGNERVSRNRPPASRSIVSNSGALYQKSAHTIKVANASRTNIMMALEKSIHRIYKIRTFSRVVRCQVISTEQQSLNENHQRPLETEEARLLSIGQQLLAKNQQHSLGLEDLMAALKTDMDNVASSLQRFGKETIERDREKLLSRIVISEQHSEDDFASPQRADTERTKMSVSPAPKSSNLYSHSISGVLDVQRESVSPQALGPNQPPHSYTSEQYRYNNEPPNVCNGPFMGWQQNINCSSSLQDQMKSLKSDMDEIMAQFSRGCSSTISPQSTSQSATQNDCVQFMAHPLDRGKEDTFCSYSHYSPPEPRGAAGLPYLSTFLTDQENACHRNNRLEAFMVGTSADVLATSHRESKAEQSPASIHSHATALPWLNKEIAGKMSAAPSAYSTFVRGASPPSLSTANCCAGGAPSFLL